MRGSMGVRRSEAGIAATEDPAKGGGHACKTFDLDQGFVAGPVVA